MIQENPVAVAVMQPGQETRSFQISYYLTRRESEEETSRCGYGVLVRLCGEGRVMDESAAGDLSSCRERVLAFIELLSKNAVTPVALRDVVEDFLPL